MRIFEGFKSVAPVIGLIFLTNCAAHKTVQYQQLQIPSEIVLKLSNGETLEGIAVEKSGGGLQLRTGETAETISVLPSHIKKIRMYPPIHDERGQLISIREISLNRNSRYTAIYSLGGAFMSFGLGLLGSSIISRSSDSDFKVFNPISIGAGVAGLILFNRLGSKRDYRFAVERVKDHRKLYAEKQLEDEQKRKADLQKEIDAIQNEKTRLEEEKKDLEQKLKKKKPGSTQLR